MAQQSRNKSERRPCCSASTIGNWPASFAIGPGLGCGFTKGDGATSLGKRIMHCQQISHDWENKFGGVIQYITPLRVQVQWKAQVDINLAMQ